MCPTRDGRTKSLSLYAFPVVFWKQYVKMSVILAFRAVDPSSIHATKIPVERNSSREVWLVKKQP